MPSKKSRKDRFYASIDQGYSRERSLRRAGFKPGNPHAAAVQASRLLADRYGKVPKGFHDLTERLKETWRALSNEDKASLSNLKPEDGTLADNLEEYTPEAAERRKRERKAKPAPKPTPPAPPPVPIPEPEPTWAFPIAGYGFIEPSSKRFEDIEGNCGLPIDFILGLSETAYQDRPVENGLWVDGAFTSDSDRIDADFRARAEARTIESRRIISNSEVLRRR